MKILNLYAGIGGNRKLWDGHDITSVEFREDIADVYRNYFPNDTLIVGDAHQYLLDHYCAMGIFQSNNISQTSLF